MKTLIAILLAIGLSSPALAQTKAKPKSKPKPAKQSTAKKSSTPKASSSKAKVKSKSSSSKPKSSSSKTTSKKTSASKTTSKSSASKTTSKSSASKSSSTKPSSKSASSTAKKTTRPAGKQGPSKSKPWLSEATPALQKKAAGQVKRMKAGDRTKLLNLLNKGKSQDILMMEGIGDAKAKHLIKGRPYKKVDDAINITGIGEKLFSNMLKHAKKPKLIGLAPVAKKKATK